MLSLTAVTLLLHKIGPAAHIYPSSVSFRRVFRKAGPVAVPVLSGSDAAFDRSIKNSRCRYDLPCIIRSGLAAFDVAEGSPQRAILLGNLMVERPPRPR